VRDAEGNPIKEGEPSDGGPIFDAGIGEFATSRPTFPLGWTAAHMEKGIPNKNKTAIEARRLFWDCALIPC
jgi:hypothetical protein